MATINNPILKKKKKPFCCVFTILKTFCLLEFFVVVTLLYTLKNSTFFVLSQKESRLVVDVVNVEITVMMIIIAII